MRKDELIIGVQLFLSKHLPILDWKLRTVIPQRHITKGKGLYTALGNFMVSEKQKMVFRTSRVARAYGQTTIK